MSEKARVELRFDQDVYDKVKALADAAGISLNQLMHGLARWAGECGHAGEIVQDSEYGWRTRQQPGCVWFGEDGPVVGLDFTERRVVREDWRGDAKGGTKRPGKRSKQ